MNKHRGPIRPRPISINNRRVTHTEAAVDMRDIKSVIRSLAKSMSDDELEVKCEELASGVQEEYPWVDAAIIKRVVLMC